MKKILILFFFIISIYSYSQSNYKITYELTDSFSLLEKTKCELYISKETSLFLMHSKILDPNNLRFNEEETEVVGDTITHIYEIYKDFKSSSIYSESIVKYQTGKVQKDLLNSMEWSPINQEKLILGYKCKGALLNYRGREYIAYYAENLKIEDGPWKFHGLPGLILEVKEIQNRISYVVTEIEKITRPFNFETSLNVNDTHSWAKIIAEARKKYVERKKILEKKYNGTVQTDFSNSLEVYDLNNKTNYSVTYGVFSKFSENNESQKTLETDFELITNGVESNYIFLDKVQNVQGVSEYGFISEVGVLYKNLRDMEYQQNKEIYGKKFIVVDSIPLLDWKVLSKSNNDTILGYKTRKAIANYEGYYIQAWFCPDILIENGPERYAGLPGLILKLIIQDNKKEQIKEITHYEAKKINKIEVLNITKPKRGKILTQNEYNNIMTEVNKKMMDTYSSGVDTSE